MISNTRVRHFIWIWLIVQERITHFYNCVGCLMTQQLQSLALESLESFTDLLVQPPHSVLPYEHSGLIVRVLLEDAEIKYEPAFNEFEVLAQQTTFFRSYADIVYSIFIHLAESSVFGLTK